MSRINISKLCFGHDGSKYLFDNVSLQLDSNWKLGLIGRNGRGKTTFLKLLMGEHLYEGTIQSAVSFDYFPFAVRDTHWSAQDLARRLRPGTQPWEVEREASLIELSLEALDRPIATLSAGEVVKLLLVLLFLRENNFLLIDEPTNHLDLQARQAVGRYLERKSGFILVSHDRSLLDNCVDHILSINKSTIELQQGNFTSWSRNRQRQEQYEQAEHQKLRGEVARLAKSARQGSAWAALGEKEKYGNGPVDRGYLGHKAAKMMRRAKAVEARRQKALEESSKLLQDVEFIAPLSMRPLDYHGKWLVEAVGLGIEYEGRRVVDNLLFRVAKGDRLVLRGRNGSGKSSIIGAITGVRAHSRGTLTVPPSVRISYVPQNTSFLRGSIRDFARERGIDEGAYRTVLDRLGFERRLFDLDMALFSSGQKKKALLAASICQEAHLYVWDEPLNYIDLPSRLQIENLILESCPSMIVIEHDQSFAERVGTVFLDLDQARAVNTDQLRS